MCEIERLAPVENLGFQEYERYAAGGRARANGAKRAEDGTFLPTEDREKR
jgi:hypothetical protein